MLLLAASTPALGATKHFRVSCEHFRAYANNAAELYLNTERAAEKSILSHLSAISNIYAEKAYTIMNLTDVLEHLVGKRDRVYTLERLREVKRLTLASLPQDIKILTDLVETQENRELQTLGLQIINEMRVFARNTDNL
jgi:hypothetical protein